MAVEKVQKIAATAEEAFNEGFFGETNSYPNEFHEASGEAEAMRAEVTGIDATTYEVPETPAASAKGAVVNSNDAPKPSGGTSGPGASTDVSKDDKEKR